MINISLNLKCFIFADVMSDIWLSGITVKINNCIKNNITFFLPLQTNKKKFEPNRFSRSQLINDHIFLHNLFIYRYSLSHPENIVNRGFCFIHNFVIRIPVEYIYLFVLLAPGAHSRVADRCSDRWTKMDRYMCMVLCQFLYSAVHYLTTDWCHSLVH